MLAETKTFILDLVQKRAIIFELAKRDFQQQYQGSYLGFIWMFLQPLLFFLVLYVIFTFGFRSAGTGDMPFELYLISGMIAWMFFGGTFSSLTGVVKNHAFLVKKVDFRLSVLPIIKILSNLPAHVFLLAVAIALCWYRGYAPSLYTLQIIYYLLAMLLLLLGLGWLTSSSSIFIKDISNIVAVFVQFGFWLTPIFWNISMIPSKYQWIFELNPMFYIITGYRDSLISHTPFWYRWEDGIFFWSVALFFLLIGITTFRKLKPHFAEVI